MFYSDFIEKYDVYELGEPGNLAVSKDGYTFYNVCSTFSSVFIKMATEFMTKYQPGRYELIDGNFILTDRYKVKHHKCTLSSWQYRETIKWIEVKNETPFWQALLAYTYDNKIRRKITTGMDISPKEMISTVENLMDDEWDELKNRLIKVYPEIVHYVEASPLARASAILNTAYYVENEEYFDNLMKESDNDWK